MVKCAACGRFLSAKGGATCNNSACHNRYHLACLLLPDPSQISSDWLCPECRGKLPRGDNSATPVKDLGSGPPVTPAAAPALAVAPVEIASRAAAAPLTAVSAAVAAPVAAEIQGGMIRSPVAVTKPPAVVTKPPAAVTKLPAAVTKPPAAVSKPPAAVAKVLCRAGSEQSTDGEPSPDTQLTLREEIRLFRSELREVRDEMREFRREMAGLHSSMGVCTERVDSLEARIEALEGRQTAAVSDGKVGRLEQIVQQLQLDLNDREQELLGSDLEIANIPETPGENVLHTVGLVAATLGVTLDHRDIVFAQRVGMRAEREVLTSSTGSASPVGGASPVGVAAATGRGRRIVVRLTRRALRDDLLQSARVRRGSSTADMGLSAQPRRFYLNERLTKSNRHLFYLVREAGSRLGWRYTWTKFGRILAKQGDGKPTHCIRSEQDLARVFGCEVSAAKDA